MESFDYLSALRRRWQVIVVTIAVALAAALLLSWLVPAEPRAQQYGASTVILGPTKGEEGPNLETMSRLVTIGEVPRRVADRVGFTGDPRDLAAQVQAVADREIGLMWITAKANTGPQAEVLADGFAEELLAYRTNAQSAAMTAEAKDVSRQIARLDRQIKETSEEIAQGGADAQILQAHLQALLAEYEIQTQRRSQLAGQTPSPEMFIIEEADSYLVSASGVEIFQTLPGRLAIAALLALIAGVGLALLLERSDRRIRNKEGAERHFGAPVLAEIPVLRKSEAKEIVATAKPKSLAADEYRFLAAALDASNGKDGPTSGKTILVCSAGPAEGSTTVAANLAAVLGETGRNVLSLSCDLRRPGLHHMLGVPAGKGLAEALQSANGHLVLNGYVRMTPFKNVRMVPSGDPPAKPAELLSGGHMHRALHEARQRADVVVMDAPPVLSASEAAHLATEVDAVVVVARAGKTTVDQAELTAERLKTVGAPVVGVALTAASETVVGQGRSRGS
jgi:capsular exopolysaccharide synthesis family protein